VQIPVSGGVHIPAPSFSALYGNVHFPCDSDGLFLENSRKHRDLEADKGETWKKAVVTN
jgi:hypothetical protein